MFRHFKFKGCSENRKCGAFLKKRSSVQLTTIFEDCFCMWWCNLFWSPNFLYSISFGAEILEKQFLAQCHVQLHFCKRFNCENQIWAVNPSLNSIRKHCQSIFWVDNSIPFSLQLEFQVFLVYLISYTKTKANDSVFLFVVIQICAY